MPVEPGHLERLSIKVFKEQYAPVLHQPWHTKNGFVLKSYKAQI
jgi:hypothetical protein